MKIYTLRIQEEGKTQQSYHNYDNYGFFERDTIKQVAQAFLEIVGQRISDFKKTTIYQVDIEKMKDAIVYVYKSSHIDYCLICDEMIKKDMISIFLGELSHCSTNNQREKLFEDFNNNPHKYQSKIDKIQKEINNTKEVIHKNIEQMLNRGESLDNLMVKSGELNDLSIIFYKKAKKTNKCCIIL